MSGLILFRALPILQVEWLLILQGSVFCVVFVLVVFVISASHSINSSLLDKLSVNHKSHTINDTVT